MVPDHRCFCNIRRILWDNFVGNSEGKCTALGLRVQVLEPEVNQVPPERLLSYLIFALLLYDQTC